MRCLTVLFLCVFCFAGWSQQTCLVVFTDKDAVTCDAESYLCKKAIERRAKHGVALDNWSDLPVDECYISQVTSLGIPVRHRLRWHNAISCVLTSDQKAQVRSLPCTKEVITLGTHEAQLASSPDKTVYGVKVLARAQLDRMGGYDFYNAGYRGKGMRVAILDAGFPGVDYLQAFKHIRDEKRIIAHYDFIKNRPDTYSGNKHGTMVLSNIGGMLDTIPLGMATDAEFLLARTESMFREGISDEENWLAAVEWADKNGADIINSSLGYTKRMYFRKDMDGKTSLISRSANLAASKGILVVNSAGNEGSDPQWVTIGAPADADSVLAVGGINPWTNLHTSWSSYGPSADRRIKPNVCAFGHTTIAYTKGIEEVTGTSFASPLTAGFAACAWGTDTTMTNMMLFGELQKSGDLYPYYDYAHGYGVPQARYFLNNLIEPDSTLTIIREGNALVKVVIKPKYFNRATLTTPDYSVWNSVSKLEEPFYHFPDQGYSSYSNGIFSTSSEYLYYSIQGDAPYLEKYFVVGIEQPEVLTIPIDENSRGKTYRFHYKGFTTEYEIK